MEEKRVWSPFLLDHLKLEPGLKDLDQALALDPTHAEAWAMRGAGWSLKQEYARAIADYDEALKRNPHLADVYVSRGLLRLMQGKVAEAEADFAQCRALGVTLQPATEQLLKETKERLAAR